MPTRRRTWFRSATASLAVLLGAIGPLAAQQRAAAAPTMKGIWEPVSYGEDVSLNSVYFVTVEEGWVTGGNGSANGVLLHTKDGGQTWEVVLGDPGGNQREFYGLRFVDQLTGFVVQATNSGPHRLLRTTNGADWTVTGTVPEHVIDYRFLSATDGVTTESGAILRTTDAGKSWKEVFQCALRVQVAGLTRNAACLIDAFAFPSASVGYAIGYSYDVPGLYVFRTEDGGQTWTGALAVPGDDTGKEGHVFFTSEQTGYICTQGGSLFGTTDGGVVWTGLPGASCERHAQLLFADPEVGWALHYHTLTYTVDGGRRWVSRQVPLPAQVAAFSLPRRDRAYAVGGHGMVYRYRVVPTAEAVAQALAAPVMPAVPSVLEAEVTKLETQVTALNSFVQAAPEASAAAAPAPGTEPPTDPAAPGLAGEPAASPFVGGCCGKPLGTVTLILKAVGGIVPDFIAKYKNLNLLAQGLRTAATLPELAESLRTALRAFRTSTDRAAASIALNDMKTALASLAAAVDTAMQKPR